MKRLPLKELFMYLSYVDLRSVRKWCKKNEVFIIRHGKDEFVFESDFKKAFEIPFINHLKKQFGKNWEEAYRLYAEENILGLTSLQPSTSSPRKSFKAQHDIVSKYLSKYESDKKLKAA